MTGACSQPPLVPDLFPLCPDHRPSRCPCCSVSTPSSFLPQGLCTCCSLGPTTLPFPAILSAARRLFLEPRSDRATLPTETPAMAFGRTAQPGPQGLHQAPTSLISLSSSDPPGLKATLSFSELFEAARLSLTPERWRTGHAPPRLSQGLLLPVKVQVQHRLLRDPPHAAPFSGLPRHLASATRPSAPALGWRGLGLACRPPGDVDRHGAHQTAGCKRLDPPWPSPCM